MLMFRFWGSDSRGSEKSVEQQHHHQRQSFSSPAVGTINPTLQAGQSLKRARPGADTEDRWANDAASIKRAKLSSENGEDVEVNSPVSGLSDMDRARDEIRHQFGVEVLLKHSELRLINQELGKCQAALEQLRRCHLIPYPVNCPTPAQMLDISAGKGPALQPQQGEAVPRWAPPFGVVDGPYARHYAKWLIPDPAFDGQQPEWQFTAEAARARASYSEGRTTRNSFAEPSPLGKGRSGRGALGAKLQALPASYPQAKDKAGPCVLKRSDGETVKLVCIDCHRENFSSTQGFINHCRIAHKRDFKSHDEAAVHCGQPIDAPQADKPASMPTDDKSQNASAQPVATSTPPTSVHPFAQADISETYQLLRSRLNDSLAMYRAGRLPGSKPAPPKKITTQGIASAKQAKPKFVPSSATPHLSRLMQSRKFEGSLHDLVAEAKTKVSFEDITPGEESDDTDTPAPATVGGAAARAPVVMRFPAKGGKSSSSPVQSNRPASSKGRGAQAHIASPPESATEATSKHSFQTVLSDDDLDMEDANLSPNTLVSNNAPSLVSDDGDYDDSDDASSISSVGDSIDGESVSDVAEITLDDEHDPRPLRRGSASASTAMGLRKEEAKQVSLVSPVKRRTQTRRSRRV